MQRFTIRKWCNEFQYQLALVCTLIFLALCPQVTYAQGLLDSSNGSWVATWTAAQQLLVAPFRVGEKDRERAKLPDALHDQTIRMIVHTSIGGKSVRIHLSNAIGAAPVTIGSIHVANRNGQGSEIVAGSDRTVTFSGKRSVSIQPGVIL
jgi:hypothetical protein